MSAIAKSSHVVAGTTMLGSVVDGSTVPATVMVDGSDTATEAFAIGSYQPTTGDRVMLEKVGRQLVLMGTTQVVDGVPQPSAWMTATLTTATTLVANTWLETGPDQLNDGGQGGQITLSAASRLVFPSNGYYMVLLWVTFPNLAAATRIQMSPGVAGQGVGYGPTETAVDQTFQIMTPGPALCSNPIPQYITAGAAFAAYLRSSAALTIASYKLRMFGWRVL